MSRTYNWHGIHNAVTFMDNTGSMTLPTEALRQWNDIPPTSANFGKDDEEFDEGSSDRVYNELKSMLTDAQYNSYMNLVERWQSVGQPQLELGGGGAVVVNVFGENGGCMTIGIEPDGYTHS